MSYLHYLCLFGSSLPPVVSRRAPVLFVFFIYCGWWCSVGGLMFYLCFLFIMDGGVL